MKRYVCIFPGLYNYILAKDVGMIPYTLSDKYNCSIITYDNDEYSYFYDMYRKDNFTLDYLNDTGDEKGDVMNYLKDNSKNIDIIQFYHLRYKLLLYYLLTYRLHNRKGHVYLKLDANNDMIDFLVKRRGLLPSLRRVYTRFLFGFVDTVSIETRRNYDILSSSGIVGEDKLIYLPNGVSESDISIENKEKIILYVGFVEKKNKSIDVLLNSIKDVQLNEWKLVLVGEIKEDIQEFLSEYFDENPHLKDKIILKGYISDKKILYEEYAKSSIYCCVSKSESFGISTLEAAYHGNYILSTNVGGSSDIIDTGNYGKIITHDNLKENIEYTINNWDNIKENPKKIQEKIYSEYNWNTLCNRLRKKLER